MKINPHTTLKCVADYVGAKKIIGDPNFVISGLNEIHEVEPGDITFVDHPKYYSKALNSLATTIIINSEEVECPEGKALIVHDCPLDAFNKLILSYRRFEPATSMVSAKAEIGEGTIIQPGAFVADKVKIGKNCIIHPNVTIYNHVVIGDNVTIYPNNILQGKTVVGDNVILQTGNTIINSHIGNGCVLCNSVVDKSKIKDGTNLVPFSYVLEGNIKK
mgnify:CR=1 FL=1